VRIVEEQVIPGTDEAKFALRLRLSFDDEDSSEEPRGRASANDSMPIANRNPSAPHPIRALD
jgi:hypothetical protein